MSTVALASPKNAMRALLSAGEAASVVARILRKSSRIDSWSSTTRMRRFFASAMVLRRHQGGLLFQDEVQRERGAGTGPVAPGGEFRAHLGSGVGRDVKAEPVTVLLGRETVLEDPRQVGGRNADAVVAHLDTRRARVGSRDPQREPLIRAAALEQRLT